jgi:hypothetical protein
MLTFTLKSPGRYSGTDPNLNEKSTRAQVHR